MGYWDALQRQEHLGVLSTGLCGWMRRKVRWDDGTSKQFEALCRLVGSCCHVSFGRIEICPKK